MPGFTKPGAGAHIEWGHPLTRGLRRAHLLNNGSTLDSVTGKTGTLTNGATVDYMGARLDGSDDFIAYDDLDLSLITIVARCISLGTSSGANAGQYIVNKNYDGSFVPYSLSIGADPAATHGMASYNGSSGLWDFSGITTDLRNAKRWATVGGSWDSLGTARYWINGKVDSASVGNRTSLPTNNNVYDIGRYRNDSASFNGIIEYVYIWDRPLSADEMLWVHNEPYTFFEARALRRVVLFGGSLITPSEATLAEEIPALTESLEGGTSEIAYEAAEPLPALTESDEIAVTTQTLQPGSAVRTPYVPGVWLMSEEPLRPGSAIRAPYAPGLLLFTAEDEAAEITAGLYNLSDLATLVAPLTLRRRPAWQDVLSDAGSGSITIHHDDPALDLFANDGSDIIFVDYRGVRAVELIPNRKHAVHIGTNEEPEEATTYTGLLTLGVLAKGILDPTGGPDRSPIEEDRHFGWPAPSFDHSTWGPATVIGNITDAIVVAAIIIDGYPPSESTVEAVRSRLAGSLPTEDFALIWAPGGSLSPEIQTPPGDIYTYEEFTIDIAGDYTFYGVADDEAEFFIDGQEVTSVSGLNYLGVGSAFVSLSEGTHSVAVHVRNLPFESGANSGKMGWVISSEQTMASLVDPGESVTIIAKGTGAAKVLAYPAEPPGQTVTKTFRIALEECQARGFLPYVRCAFTDTNYTDGRAALPIPDIGSKVSTSLLGFAREISSTYVDMAARAVVVQELNDVEELVDVGYIDIYMWERGISGFTRDIEFVDIEPPDPNDQTTGNLDKFEEDVEINDVQRALLRWKGGWTALVTGEEGGSEAPLEVGAPDSLEEVLRMATAALSDVRSGKAELTAGLRARFAAEDVYSGFTVRDTILSTPTGSERVVSITFAEDEETGNLTIDIGLRQLLYSDLAKIARDLQKIIG